MLQHVHGFLDQNKYKQHIVKVYKNLPVSQIFQYQLS